MRAYVVEMRGNIVAWTIVGAAVGLGIYACVLFNGISAGLAHGIISLFF